MILSLVAIVAVLALYVSRLVQYQIVDGESYATRDEQTYTVTVAIEASRGEIFDRYGRPLAVNKQGYAIAFDKTYIPAGELNQTILTTLRLLEKMSETWNDSLPISRAEPFTFLEGQDTLVEALKTRYRLNAWATAEDLLNAMKSSYNISDDFSPEEVRMIASVRYAMDIYGFNVQNPYTVAEDVSSDTVMLFEENSFQLPGVTAKEVAVRDYPNGTVAPHVVGTVSPIYAEEYEELKEKGYSMSDKIGRSGLEAAYEDYLRGEDGEKTVTFNMSGEVVKEEITKQPVAGGAVYATIDSGLTSFTQAALGNRISEIAANAAEGDPGYDACAGAVVIEQVKTGELLTVAVWPSYDLSTYYEDYSELAADPSRPLWNRAMYGTYAPGSTFKPCVTLAALAEGIVTDDTKVNCNGVYTYYEDYQPTCMGSHGATNLVRALQYSCNIYYYEVGRLLGIDAIDEYANAMGLGVKTGVEIGEAEGVIANPEYKAELLQLWNPGDVIQAAIGQSDTGVTPLQLASYTSTLATKGIRYKTRLVRAVKSYDLTETLYEAEPEVMADLSEYAEAFESVRDGMIASATAGTVQSWFGNYSVLVATKTGTPQTGQSEKSNNSSFIAFAPADDPEIAVAIVIEQGGHGYYIAPLMKDILDYYFSHLEEAPDAAGTLLE